MEYSEAEKEFLKGCVKDVIDEKYLSAIHEMKKKLIIAMSKEEALKERLNRYEEEIEEFKKCHECHQAMIEKRDAQTQYRVPTDQPEKSTVKPEVTVKSRAEPLVEAPKQLSKVNVLLERPKQKVFLPADAKEQSGSVERSVVKSEEHLGKNGLNNLKSTAERTDKPVKQPPEQSTKQPTDQTVNHTSKTSESLPRRPSEQSTKQATRQANDNTPRTPQPPIIDLTLDD